MNILQNVDRSLADDLLFGVEAIAACVHGEATPRNIRQTRYLIQAHGFPHIQRGRLIYSRRSWIDAYFSLEAEA